MAHRIFRCLATALLLCGNGLTLAQEPSADDAATPPPGSTVYRTVDGQGNVIFTDNPPADRPAEPVTVKPANAMPAFVRSQPGGEGQKQTEKAVNQPYTLLEVASPEHDYVFDQGTNGVHISVNLEPSLQEGDSIELVYDGKVVSHELAYDVMDDELVRGTHTVEARVYDSSGSLLMEAKPLQFHVRRTSALDSDGKPKLPVPIAPGNQPGGTPGGNPGGSGSSPGAQNGNGGMPGMSGFGSSGDSRSSGNTRQPSGAPSRGFGSSGGR